MKSNTLLLQESLMGSLFKKALKHRKTEMPVSRQKSEEDRRTNWHREDHTCLKGGRQDTQRCLASCRHLVVMTGVRIPWPRAQIFLCMYVRPGHTYIQIGTDMYVRPDFSRRSFVCVRSRSRSAAWTQRTQNVGLLAFSIKYILFV